MHFCEWQLLLLSARVLATRGLTGTRGLTATRGLTGTRGIAEAQDRNLIQVGTGGHRYVQISICVCICQ